MAASNTAQMVHNAKLLRGVTEFRASAPPREHASASDATIRPPTSPATRPLPPRRRTRRSQSAATSFPRRRRRSRSRCHRLCSNRRGTFPLSRPGPVPPVPPARPLLAPLRPRAASHTRLEDRGGSGTNPRSWLRSRRASTRSAQPSLSKCLPASRVFARTPTRASARRRTQPQPRTPHARTQSPGTRTPARRGRTRAR